MFNFISSFASSAQTILPEMISVKNFKSKAVPLAGLFFAATIICKIIKMYRENDVVSNNQYAQLQNANASLTSNVADLKARLKEKETQVDQLTQNGAMDRLRAENETLTNQFEASRALIDELRQSFTKLLDERDQVTLAKSNLDGELQIKNSEIESLKVEVDSTRGNFLELLAENDSLKKRLTSSDELTRNINSNMKLCVDKLDETQKMLKEQTEQTTGLILDSNVKENEIRRLKERNSELEIELRKCQTDLSILSTHSSQNGKNSFSSSMTVPTDHERHQQSNRKPKKQPIRMLPAAYEIRPA